MTVSTVVDVVDSLFDVCDGSDVAVDDDDGDDEAFFFCFGSSQPYRGLKLSMTPQSSNRLGKSQNPRGKITIVMIKRIKRTIAIPKKTPRRPNVATLRYHTPNFKKSGHRGNKTAVRMAPTNPTAPR